MFRHAVVRRPSLSFAQGITTAGLGAPDAALAREQHAAYCRALESCGLSVTVLPSLESHPDCCFVEDTAVLLPGGAVMGRFGAVPRRGEGESVAEALAGLMAVQALPGEGRLEGGDVLLVDRHFFIGQSKRTDRAGAEALGRLAEAQGFTWSTLPVTREPHLKTGLTWVGGASLVMAPEFAGRPELVGYDCIVTDEAEAYAACCLFLNGTILMPANHPETKAKLARLGRPIVEVAMSEFEKMDGGLTCLSLRW